jgi:hypothetical protein
MYLDGQLLAREEKLDQQREALGLACRLAHEGASVLAAEFAECSAGERAIGDTVIISG